MKWEKWVTYTIHWATFFKNKKFSTVYVSATLIQSVRQNRRATWESVEFPLTKTYSKDVNLRLLLMVKTSIFRHLPYANLTEFKIKVFTSVFQLLLQTSKRWFFGDSKFKSLHENPNVLHVGKATGCNQLYNLTSYRAPCIFNYLTLINWFQRFSLIECHPVLNYSLLCWISCFHHPTLEQQPELMKVSIRL